MKNLIIRSLIFIWMLALTVPLFATDASLLPNGKQTFLDQNGNPLSSGKVYFYTPSTTTFKTTWQNAGKTIANTNPVTLDAAGRAIIYGDGTYRQVVRDSLGNLIWDQLTASTGAGGGTPTLVGDGNLVGTVLPWSGLVAPNQYVFTYGQEISRATYPLFFTAITLNQNVNCSSGNPILTGLSDTTQIPVGATIEVSCLAPGTTVISKTSTTITVSTNATISTTASSVIFPWGNGNGSTTFNVPDYRGRTLAGRDNMGGTTASRLTSAYYGETADALGANGGSQNQTLITANLPAYTPSGTNAITDPGHKHVVVNSDTTGGAALTANNYLMGSADNGTAFSYTLKGTATVASTGGTSTNTTGITSAFSGTAQGGTSAAFATIQPTITINYIVKITPDISSSVATGVTSLGGMTGTIACGYRIICTSNVVSFDDSALIPENNNWTQNILHNGDFSQWTLCPLFDCSVILTDGSLTGSSGFVITPTSSAVNVWPDGWSLSGTGYGGATTWLMRSFIPTNQTSVESYPFRYSATTWTTAPTSASTTENPSPCAGPNVAFGTIAGCRNTYFDSQSVVGFVNYGMTQQTYTMAVNTRTGRRITNVTNNGSGLCRFTVATTSGMTTAQFATVAGLIGTTACNGSGTITVVNGTTVDFSNSFSGVYDATSDGLIANQPIFITPVLYYSMAYNNWLVGQFPSLEGNYIQNSGSDGQFYAYKVISGSGTTGRAIVGVADNGGGLCRIQIDSTTNYTTGQTGSSVAPGTGCTGSFVITVIDATHIDLIASTFSGVYTAGGYIGVAPVQSTKGATQSDGNILWENIGFAKGRTYDIYQGQYTNNTVTSSGYNQGAATQVSGGIGNACAVTATWQKCVVTILVPAAEYNNTGDYAWSATDPIRQLLPWVIYNGNAAQANAASLVAGIDIIGPIGLQEIDIAELSAVPGVTAMSFRPPPPQFNRVTTLPFNDIIGYLPQNTQKTGIFVQSRYNDVGNQATFERRTITGNSPITITNGDAVAGNPIVVCATCLTATVTTVGALGTCDASTKAFRKFVTDSNAASFTAGIGAVVAAGGTTNVPVTCDGTNWRIGMNKPANDNNIYLRKVG